MTRSIQDVLLAFCRALDDAEAPYAIVGGFAASTWGVPRSTQDVDAIVLLSPGDIPTFVEHLARHSLRVEEADLEDALSEGTHATVLNAESIFHVDLVPVSRPAQRATLQDARSVHIEGVEVRMASPEDTIANKLYFGSPRDLRDALGILVRQQATLNSDLLSARCEALHVTEGLVELQRVALEESE